MKILLTLCMIIAAQFVFAAEHPGPMRPAQMQPESAVVKGEVLEVKLVENFVYLRLNTRDGEVWAAVVNTPVKKGAVVTIENVTVMSNFESKALKRTFPTILFGNLGGAAASATEGTVMGSAYLANKMDGGDMHVPKASGANAHTVAEIISRAAVLKDKIVVVSGKVVKYNADIMGRNWLHLRDGSGSAADETNDILVTTKGQAKLGDVVTVKGVVHTDQDFGAGYAYKVLIEEATLQ